MPSDDKISFSGKIIGVQPRIRMTRSFTERYHTYLGFNLTIDGQIGENQRTFIIAIGKGAQEKHQFKAGMSVQGLGQEVADKRTEIAELYKISKLKSEDGEFTPPVPPPMYGTPRTLEEYRARGHKRLDAKRYEDKCSTCIYGCKMPVEIIIDQWNPRKKKYRVETWCYGPLSCLLYKAGPKRKLQGRESYMKMVEEDWIDEEATSHRGPDE